MTAMMISKITTANIRFNVFIVFSFNKSKAPTDFSADAVLVPILRLPCRISLWRILFLFRSLFPNFPEQFPNAADNLER